MVYAMRAAARVGIPFVVLDRPNPLGGRTEGILLDSALANPEDPTPQRRGQAYALYPGAPATRYDDGGDGALVRGRAEDTGAAHRRQR
jgi:uncharacterized protein YbbC (DUF1343 family)